jgi:IS30 family transposase
MARPKKPINKEDLEKLAAMHCTIEEIAAWFNVSRDTIERRYAAEIHKARQQGKISLRRMQFQAAQNGNIVMMIWLGKQILDQTERKEISMGDVQPITLAYLPKSQRTKDENSL